MQLDGTGTGRIGRHGHSVTGALEIDCLICHLSNGRYDHEDRSTAIKGQDFRWAPTIAAGLGTFASFRSAGSIAGQWHPGRPVPTTLPAIKYDQTAPFPIGDIKVKAQVVTDGKIVPLSDAWMDVPKLEKW